MAETRNYLNQIESGTFTSTQKIILKNKNKIKVNELKFNIYPNSSKQKEFDHKKFKFKISVKLENNNIETQEVVLSKFLGIDAYTFELSLLKVKFKFNLTFCKDKIILYSQDHQNAMNNEYGIFYNELAIFLNKII